MNWQPIETAPKDGTRIKGLAKRFDEQNVIASVKETWWGKASHVPLYGWCFGEVENVDLWKPEFWTASE